MVAKDDRIYIRITSKTKEEFEKAAEHHGLKPAALLHSLLVKAINEAKKENPELFKDTAETSGKREMPVMTLEEAIADNKRKQEKDKKMPPK